MKRQRKKISLVNVLLYIIMVLLAVVLLFPFFYMISKSLMTSEEVINPVPQFFPAVPQFGNYLSLFSTNEYLLGFAYTLAIVCCNMISVPFSAGLAAFSFSKIKWKGRGLMFAVMLGTMMLPGAITQVPLYSLYFSFGWIDTLWPFIVPNFFGGGAVYIFLLTQFMRGIPKDMDNAAKIDGASAFRRFISINFPLCKAVLIYVIVNVFLAYWGDYYGPLMYMHSSSAPKTFALVLFEKAMDTDSAMDMANIRMAGGVFMSVFPALLFAVFQKQLIGGVMIGSVKG